MRLTFMHASIVFICTLLGTFAINPFDNNLNKPLIGDACQSTDDCHPTDTGAICVDEVCVCPQGSIIDDHGKCVLLSGIPDSTFPLVFSTPPLIYDSLLGDYCENNNNCGGLISGAECRANRCVCRAGLVADGVDNCIPGSGLLETTIPTTPVVTPIYYDSLLGGSCDTNSNCGGLVGNAVCVDGICVCQAGYLAISNDRCILDPGSTSQLPTTNEVTWGDSGIGGTCSTNSDCQVIGGNSICINHICTCPPGSIAQDGIHCVFITVESTTISSILPKTTTLNHPKKSRCSRSKKKLVSIN